MQPHFVGKVPGKPILLVLVLGPRTEANGALSTGEIVRLRDETGIRAVLFDARNADLAGPTAGLMRRATAAGEALSQSRIAIVCHDLDAEYPRIWRRALCDTGHEAGVFTHYEEAEAWLLSEPEDELLYLA